MRRTEPPSPTDTDVDDTIAIVDDGHDTPESDDVLPRGEARWRVLVVDDDDEVHRASSFALRTARLLDRPVELLHAYDAEQAFQCIRREPDVAVALVDVVMETPNAGLDLVRRLRDAGHGDLRLVLRTGQPGQAPEAEVMQRYDINDYRTKSELSQQRLLSVLTAALRSYQYIHRINQHRSGLELVVASTAELFRRTNLAQFATGVLTQLASVLGIDTSGVVCASCERRVAAPGVSDFVVVGDAGRFQGSNGRRLSEVPHPELIEAFESTGEDDAPYIGRNGMAMRFRTRHDRMMFVYLDLPVGELEDDLALLRLFAGNIAICFENVSLIERLDQLAFLDQPLQVPNANALERDLRRQMAWTGRPLVLVLAALDAIGTLVGTFGLQRTNVMLQSLYQRLADGLPNVYLVARVGEGRFAVLMAGEHFDVERFDALIRGWRPDPALPRPPSVTAAVVEGCQAMPDPAVVLRAAHATLAEAMRLRPGRITFHDPAVLGVIDSRLQMETALRRALDNDGLDIHLQPKVDLATGRVVGAEALSRWHTRIGWVSPAEFVPIAEACGLTTAILRNAVRRVGAWHRARDGAPLPVAVNVSVYDIERPDFATRLLDLLDAERLGPADIAFEVTETGMMREEAANVAQLRVLADAGFELAVDDFGTGYSSLAYLERLPVHVLKVDRAFVNGLSDDRPQRSVAATVVAMANALEMGVVAEGVETVAQHDALRALRCGCGQGWLYGRPMPIERFDDFVAGWSLDAALAAGGAGS